MIPKIKSVPVIPIEEIAICTKTVKCKGELVFVGNGSTMGLTTVFKHRCPKCEEIYWLMGVYPKIVYKLDKKRKLK